MERISTTLRQALEEDARVLDTPPPSVATASLTDKTVELSLQAWAKASDAGALCNEFLRRLQALIQAPQAAAQAR